MMTIRRLVVSGALLGVAALPLHAETPAPATNAAPTKDAKKDSAKKDDKKKAAAKKGDADGKASKKPTVYSTKPMELRDEKGNIIPINPDAYDVSSALPGKPAPRK